MITLLSKNSTKDLIPSSKLQNNRNYRKIQWKETKWWWREISLCYSCDHPQSSHTSAMMCFSYFSIGSNHFHLNSLTRLFSSAGIGLTVFACYKVEVEFFETILYIYDIVELHFEALSLLSPPYWFVSAPCLRLILQYLTHPTSKLYRTLSQHYRIGTLTLKGITKQRVMLLFSHLWFSPCLYFFSYDRELWQCA